MVFWCSYSSWVSCSICSGANRTATAQIAGARISALGFGTTPLAQRPLALRAMNRKTLWGRVFFRFSYYLEQLAIVALCLGVAHAVSDAVRGQGVVREITHPTDGFDAACLRLAADASGGSIWERAIRGGIMGSVSTFPTPRRACAGASA